MQVRGRTVLWGNEAYAEFCRKQVAVVAEAEVGDLAPKVAARQIPHQCKSNCEKGRG